MKILGVLALFGAMSAFASTGPKDDLYADSLKIEKASAEVPQAFEATRDDGKAIESVGELVESTRANTKKSARR